MVRSCLTQRSLVVAPIFPHQSWWRVPPSAPRGPDAARRLSSLLVRRWRTGSLQVRQLRGCEARGYERM